MEGGRGSVAVAGRLRLGPAQVPVHESGVILFAGLFQVLHVMPRPLLHPLRAQQAPVAVLHWGPLVIEEQTAGADCTHTHIQKKVKSFSLGACS